ncbi:MAG: hypothetical protein NDI60_08230 [Elusimicrobiales bacterium]|nr:hypothetical protein [Elusimicrobiales bacterium]
MEKSRQNPILLIALAVLFMVTGSFFALLHVGMSARQAKGLQSGFSFRGAKPLPSSYVADIKRGAEIVSDEAARVFNDFFGDGPAAGSNTAAAGYSNTGAAPKDDEVEGEYAPDSDAFTRYYEKHYGKGASSPSLGWNDGGGVGASSGGGGDSATFQAVPRQEQAAGAPKAGADGPAQTAAAAPVSAPGAAGAAGATGFNQNRAQPPPKLFASLPPGGAPPPLFPGQSAGSSAPGRGAGAKAGELDAFQSKGGAAQLDGALESAKAGAKSDYAAKMSGGAAAAAAGGAAAGGGGAPSPSSPSNASGDGKSADKAKTDAAGTSTGYGWWNRESDDTPAAATPKAEEDDDADLVKAVVTERRNGADAAYLSDDDETAKPEEALLKAGVADPGAAEKDAVKPDPADFASLPPERKKELRREMHSFMKRVENRYGKMTDIYRTACSSTPDLCKEHELTRSYLTMTTAEGAKLVMGLKYVKNRWRRYTIDFKRPASKPDPAPQTDEEEEESEEEL